MALIEAACRKAVAAPILTPFGRPGVESPLLVTYVGIPMFSILTPFGRPGVEESPHLVTYVGIPMFSKHNEF